MSEEWNKMKDNEKTKYVKKAQEDRKRYEKEKAEYDARFMNSNNDNNDMEGDD